MAEAQAKKQVRVVLWGTPRSLSTAIFRAMWNKKSCKCMPEPYMLSYIFSEERVLNWFPEIPAIDGFNYRSIKKELYEAEHEEDEVFVKDFPVYIYRQKLYNPLDLLPQGYVHTFLIRPPQACIESAYRLFKRRFVPNWTEWERDTIGFKQLWDLYNEVKKTHPDPLVIHSDDLMNNPEATLRLYCERTGLKFEDSMLQWKENDGLQEKMNAMFPFLTAFTETVFSTSGFQKTHSTKPAEELPEEIQRDVEENNVYYEKLLQFATRIPPTTV